MLWIILIIIGVMLLTGFGKMDNLITTPKPPEYYHKRTSSSFSDIYNALNRAGLPSKGALLALAHAIIESRIGSLCKSCGYNYWNFGQPSWWLKYHPEDETWGKCPRADEVGYTLSFQNLAQAVESYIEVLRRSKPNCYNEIISNEPDLNKFIDWICEVGEQWAGACSLGDYQNALSIIYNKLLNGDIAV